MQRICMYVFQLLLKMAFSAIRRLEEKSSRHGVDEELDSGRGAEQIPIEAHQSRRRHQGQGKRN